MTKKEYTIISCTYDGEKVERLKAYFSAIERQTLKPRKIILCLDGNVSVEHEDVINLYINKLPLEIIRSEKIGLARNLQIALQKVNTPVTVRADTDDTMYPERIEKQIDFLYENAVDISSCFAWEHVDGNTKNLKKVPLGLITSKSISSFFKNPVNHHSCIFLTKKVSSIGYSVGRMEDYRLWVSCLNDGLKILNQSETLVSASADNIGSRRVGWDFFKAEVALFRLNCSRRVWYASFFALLALCVRAPMRTPVFRYINPLLRKYIN